MSTSVHTHQEGIAPICRRILIVDDNTEMANALATLLGKQGYETAVWFRGGEALKYALHNDFAAAVIDVHLPDFNGLVLAQKLRERSGPKVPIIILSGDTSMETLNSLPHVGATYFFSKPVNAKMLIERLSEWVPRVGATSGEDR